MDTQAIAVLGVVIASLSAIGGLANAVAAIFDTWRDNRWLKIVVELKSASKDHVRWTIKIWNSARTPNALTDLELVVDGKKMRPPVIFPGSDDKPLGSSLAAFSYRQADISVQVHDEIPAAVWQASKRIEIRVHPVRGRRRRFRFRKDELVRAS